MPTWDHLAVFRQDLRAPDGRATFQYGDEVQAGEPHIVWRRIGTHDVFDRP
jgi:hypothetical protein